ncbi:DUF4231 domain-containing protein [Saccharopolyspora shandongensis]|uniref:SLATT domain-containing protein n=1 Tax=Saccharopolyspora shandongensis TaxID=418495 RepID=UPI0033D0848F
MTSLDSDTRSLLDLEFAVWDRRDALARAQRRFRLGIVALAVGAVALCVIYFAHINLNNGEWSWLYFSLAAAFLPIVCYGIHARVFPGVFMQDTGRMLGDFFSSKNRKTVRTLRLELEKARATLHRSAEYRNAKPEQHRVAFKDDSLLYVEKLRVESRRNRRANNVLQIVIIAGSLFSTSLSSLSQSIDPVQLAAIGCSLAVGISAGLTGYFKFKDRSFYAQQTADAIEHEVDAVKLGIGRYADTEKATLKFTEEVHRLRLEQKKREQNLDQPESSTEKRQ